MLKFTVTVIICISDKNPAGLNSKQLIASFEIYIGVFWKVAWSTLGLFDLSWFIILSIPSIDYWVNGCFFIKSVHCVLHGIDGDARRETVWQRLRGQNSVEWISSFMRKIYGNIFVSWNFCDHFWIAIENRFLRMLLLNVHCSVSCVKSMNLKQYLTLTSSKSSFIFITSEVLRSVRDIFFLLCCIHFVSMNKLLLDIFLIIIFRFGQVTNIVFMISIQSFCWEIHECVRNECFGGTPTETMVSLMVTCLMHIEY